MHEIFHDSLKCPYCYYCYYYWRQTGIAKRVWGHHFLSMTPYFLPKEHTVMDIIHLGTLSLVLPSGNSTLIFPLGHSLVSLQYMGSGSQE